MAVAMPVAAADRDLNPESDVDRSAVATAVVTTAVVVATGVAILNCPVVVPHVGIAHTLNAVVAGLVVVATTTIVTATVVVAAGVVPDVNVEDDGRLVLAPGLTVFDDHPLLLHDPPFGDDRSRRSDELRRGLGRDDRDALRDGPVVGLGRIGHAHREGERDSEDDPLHEAPSLCLVAHN